MRVIMVSEQFKSCFEKCGVQHHAVGLLFCPCFCLKYVNYINIKWHNPLHAYYDGKRQINRNLENSACYLNHLLLSQSENRRGIRSVNSMGEEN